MPKAPKQPKQPIHNPNVDRPDADPDDIERPDEELEDRVGRTDAAPDMVPPGSVTSRDEVITGDDDEEEEDENRDIDDDGDDDLEEIHPTL